MLDFNSTLFYSKIVAAIKKKKLNMEVDGTEGYSLGFHLEIIIMSTVTLFSFSLLADLSLPL